MSRSERRAYKRMMKNSDPYALPAAAGARGRAAQVQRSRRAARATSGPTSFWSRRMLAWTLIGALLIGLLAFSFAWPAMPLALYVGAVGAAGWALLAVAFRAMQRRGAPTADR
jgi:hypothetical protein